MRVRNGLVLGTMLLSTALWGCGSNAGSGGDQSAAAVGAANSTIANAATVGMNVCTNCHAGQTAQWMDGVHANTEGSDRGTPNFPDYGTIDGNALDSGIACSSCHDQLGDGGRLVAELTGDSPRPVIGCESCHGGGGLHFGTGPIPYAAPDFERCGQCHNSSFDHGQYHPEGDNILEDYKSSPHSGSINQFNYAAGSTTDVQALCSRCHTDEGAKLYKGIEGGYAELSAAFADETTPVADAGVVQCRTCHDPHRPDRLLEKATLAGDGLSVLASDQFNTCTNCHQTSDGFHGENSSRGLNAARVIYDTHLGDDPATASIEGYNIDPADERACVQCHNPHAANTRINQQWAKSGHGGRLKLFKDRVPAEATDPAEVLTAGAPNYEHEADGSETPYAPAFANPSYVYADDSRAACQRCHTATGADNFMKDPADYLARIAAGEKPNDFSYLNVFDADGNLVGQRREMLYCESCHTDNAGGLEQPGAMPFVYAPTDRGAETLASCSDMGDSNLCVACHSGQQSAQNLKNLGLTVGAGGTLVNASNAPVIFGMVNPHYRAAAATMDRTMGYEFDGRNYDNLSFYGHINIGTVDGNGNEAVPGTGTGGPCIGCHMNDSNEASVPNHRYQPYALDADDEVSGVATVCTSCHTGAFELSVDFIAGEKHGFEDALHVLENLMGDEGVYYRHDLGYPYMYTRSLAQDEADPANAIPAAFGPRQAFAFTAWDSVNTFGSVFNFSYLHTEPGAFAHNRHYTKKLVFDSIDWMDNKQLDGSITIDAVAHSGAAHWFGADGVTGVALRPDQDAGRF